MSNYQLAQLNIATMKAPLESPVMADFVANLARINALAEGSSGFVWRLQDEEAERLALLQELGASAQAFSFRQAFAAPDAQASLPIS